MIAVNYLPTQIARGDYRASSRRKLEHALVQLHGNFWLGKKKGTVPAPASEEIALAFGKYVDKKVQNNKLESRGRRYMLISENSNQN